MVQLGAEEGARNSTTASLAGHLLRHGIQADVVEDLLLGWNRVRNQPPLPNVENFRTVVSIARLEMARRGQLT